MARRRKKSDRLELTLPQYVLFIVLCIIATIFAFAYVDFAWEKTGENLKYFDVVISK